MPIMCRWWFKRRQCDGSNVCQIPKRWRCVKMWITKCANACYNVWQCVPNTSPPPPRAIPQKEGIWLAVPPTVQVAFAHIFQSGALRIHLQMSAHYFDQFIKQVHHTVIKTSCAFSCSSHTVAIFFYSLSSCQEYTPLPPLREACLRQNEWISGKFPNGLWPPPPAPFSENFIAIFSANRTKKAVSNAKKVAMKFFRSEIFRKFIRFRGDRLP